MQKQEPGKSNLKFSTLIGTNGIIRDTRQPQSVNVWICRESLCKLKAMTCDLNRARPAKLAFDLP